MLPGAMTERSALRVGSQEPSVHHVFATALLVSVAYYAGTNIGFILRIPPSIPSVLWPPNAILTATLLLAPVRRWWIYLLAALPAHLVAQLGVGWPLALVLALFATNCCEALLAAVCVRRYSDAPARFDTLRRVVVFILGAALVAPFVTSFLAAAVISAMRHAPYWLLWQTRFSSNVLSELTLVPAVVTVVSFRSTWGERTRLRCHIEAGLLALASVTIGIVVVAQVTLGAPNIPGAPYAPLALFFPLILWAALRFGPGGASFSLLAPLLLATGLMTQGPTPITALLRTEGVIAVQILLCITTIPLMCIAAVFDERRRASETLADRLRFEELLVHLSSTFVRLPGLKVETAFETALRQLGQFLGLDRVTLFRLSRDPGVFVAAYTWSSPGVGPAPRVYVSRDFPWITSQLLRERPVGFSCADELPPEAMRDAETFRRRGVRSNLAIPMVAGGRVLGSLAFVTLTVERTWPDEVVQRLRLVGEVFANALSQKEAEDTVRESESRFRTVADSAPVLIWMSGVDALRTFFNKPWLDFTGRTAEQEMGDGWTKGVHPDDLSLCLKPYCEPFEARRPLVIQYRLRRHDGEYRWVSDNGVPRYDVEGHFAGYIGSCLDITDRMHGEELRQELAHISRVATMGALTAAIIHELSQPLAAILTNAQAGLRGLTSGKTDVNNLRDILEDIVADDQRAARVMQHLRSLFQKGDVERRPILLNQIVSDVVRVVLQDAELRRVAVVTELAPGPLWVSGDRTQLQQVLLNLVMNAFEALADVTDRPRKVILCTHLLDGERVQIDVADTGPGITAEKVGSIFEHFVTSKASGMGMGLSVSRSIIEAHAGQIWAENGLKGGAIFHVVLPTIASEPTPE